MAENKPTKSALVKEPKAPKEPREPKKPKESKDPKETKPPDDKGKEKSPTPEKSPPKSPPQDAKQKGKKPPPVKPPKVKTGPCPWMCNLVPVDLPPPDAAQTVLHPRKDVFILKVAKVGANGDRRCKMELELVTPKGPEKQALCRIDTRETQCDPEPPPCTCCTRPKKKRKHA